VESDGKERPPPRWRRALGGVRGRVRAAPPQERAYWLGLLSVLLLGAFLRLNGYLWNQGSFWLDEALWAPRFVDWPLQKLGIRPIGYVWLTRQLVTLFGATEFWFRFIPNASGVLSLCLMPYVASRLLDSRVLRLLLVLVFAIHPALVDLSKEFKPYSFEVLVHLLTLVLYLRYQQTRRAAWLYALLAYLPLAFLLAYNIAFALPSLLLVVFWTAFKRRSRPLMLAAVLGGVVCAGVVYETNALLLKKVAKEGRTEEYWGQKYDVFYRAGEDDSRLVWTLEKSGDMAAMIGLRQHLWVGDERFPEPVTRRLGEADRWLWIGLTLLGVIAACYKRSARAILLLTPLLVIAGLNALGKWPFGQFRTNLFTCVYLFPLPLLALDMLGKFVQRRYQLVLAGVVAFDVLFGLALSFDLRGRKRTWSHNGYSRELIPALYELRREQLAREPGAKRARLILDLFSHKPLDYYLRVHPQFSRDYADFEKHFKVEKVSASRLIEVARRRLKGQGPVYAVASKVTSVARLERFADEKANVVAQRRIADHVLVLVLDD
jgi:hypothetical protein